jgi:hypothetical protein
MYIGGAYADQQSVSHPDLLIPEERASDIDWIGAWVNTRAGFKALRKR